MKAADVISGKRKWAIEQADCLEFLRRLPDGCVQCAVTSPPYFGLRDYGTGKWDGGLPKCDHKPNHGIQGATGQRSDRTFTAEAGNHCANTVAGVSTKTTGWEASCECAASVQPCLVLDPFSGSGTTVMVAAQLGRRGIACDLNGEYVNIGRRRILNALGLEKDHTLPPTAKDVCPLFGETV